MLANWPTLRASRTSCLIACSQSGPIRAQKRDTVSVEERESGRGMGAWNERQRLLATFLNT
jgi:hypothetical protein